MKTLKTLAVATIAIVAAQATFAAMINGDITFNGGATLDTGNVGSATAVTSFDAEVESVAGDFSAMVNAGDSVSIVAPWSFNSGAIYSFWSVGGFTFDLISSGIDFQNNAAVVVSGKGWVSGNGYEATKGTWNFSTQNPSAQNVFSFSASSEVPDSSSTSVLLGLGLVGLAAVRRFKK